MEHLDKSPELIVPVIIDLFNPTSVIDVGCGIGNWLKEFRKCGIKELTGIDGFHLDSSNLDFEGIDLKLLDLESKIKESKFFDLVLSLEVAEHLTPNRAKSFVYDLCQLGKLVVFSAAVKGQGGQNHHNEQWPSYWKKLFEENGYHFYDIIRPRIWNIEQIKPWYKQNIFVASYSPLNEFNCNMQIIDIVNPDFHKLKLQEIENGELGIKYALYCLWNAFKLRIK
jgi:SAM-dependent methyltransferase